MSVASSQAPTDDGFTLDDGTALGRIVLDGEAAASRDLVEPGDAINVVGRVVPSGEAGDGEFVVVVDDPETIVLGSVDRAEPAPLRPRPRARLPTRKRARAARVPHGQPVWWEGSTRSPEARACCRCWASGSPRSP